MLTLNELPPLPRRRRRVRRIPVVYASVYAPTARRRQWALAYICAHCGGGHFGRVAEEQELRGPRISGCGRRVHVVIARTYRVKNRTAVAA